MKLRLNFVSNSSSASYTIAYDPEKFGKCEHCGRSDRDPVAIIEGSKDSDTRMEWDGVEDRVEVLEYDIVRSRDEIAHYATRPKDELLRRWVGDTACVGQAIEWIEEDIRSIETEIASLRNLVVAGKKVIGVDIGYNDECVIEELNLMKERGKIEFIGDWPKTMLQTIGGSLTDYDK